MSHRDAPTTARSGRGVSLTITAAICLLALAAVWLVIWPHQPESATTAPTPTVVASPRASVTTSLTPIAPATSAPAAPTTGGPAVPTSVHLGRVKRYVALGDSYSAALGVGRALTGPPCYRSDENYPSLLRATLSTTVIDMTCSSAYISSLWKPQAAGVRPQLDALTPDTDLVTLLMGANDVHLMQVGVICLASGARCSSAIQGASDRIPKFATMLGQAITRIQRAAPHATVVLLTYPRLVSSAGSACVGARVSSSVATAMNQLWDAVNAQIRLLATRRGLPPAVDLWTPSTGHDICASVPWVAGRRGGGAAPLHPLEAEQRAVRDAILRSFDR